jgi:hypothetical protein
MNSGTLPVTTEARAVVESTNIFMDIAQFEHAQRVAKALQSADMVPQHFRGNLGNILIALNFASRAKADPFMIMQNLYVVHGRPGLEGKLVIALINQCGRFDPIKFRVEGNVNRPENDDDGVVAYAKEMSSGDVLDGVKVTWGMVKAEGWLSKAGSKWKTLSPLMFRYRAATFFARVYCPEVLMGMQTTEELHDVIDVSQQPDGTYADDVTARIKANAPENWWHVRANWINKTIKGLTRDLRMYKHAYSGASDEVQREVIDKIERLGGDPVEMGLLPPLVDPEEEAPAGEVVEQMEPPPAQEEHLEGTSDYSEFVSSDLFDVLTQWQDQHPAVYKQAITELGAPKNIEQGQKVLRRIDELVRE